MPSYKQHSKKIKECYAWPRGECRFGSECWSNHHENLDPDMFTSAKYPGAKVSNEKGVGCHRCLQAGRQCDKLDHPGGPEDPCSGCRWFGGDSAACTLVENTSYNDHLWGLMLARPNAGFTLPAFKPQDAPTGQKTIVAPEPMPDDKVMAGWTGKSREEILAIDDMLNDRIRAHPRAYLTPPEHDFQEEYLEDDVDDDDTFEPERCNEEPPTTTQTQAEAQQDPFSKTFRVGDDDIDLYNLVTQQLAALAEEYESGDEDYE